MGRSLCGARGRNFTSDKKRFQARNGLRGNANVQARMKKVLRQDVAGGKACGFESNDGC